MIFFTTPDSVTNLEEDNTVETGFANKRDILIRGGVKWIRQRILVRQDMDMSVLMNPVTRMPTGTQEWVG